MTTPPAFSDEDLNLLKASMIYGSQVPKKLEGLTIGAINLEYMKALLARLESAEDVCQAAIDQQCNIHTQIHDALQAWRRSRGK